LISDKLSSSAVKIVGGGEKMSESSCLEELKALLEEDRLYIKKIESDPEDDPGLFEAFLKRFKKDPVAWAAKVTEFVKEIRAIASKGGKEE